MEFGQIQQSVVLGLQQGSKVLQDLNQRMPIEQVEKIMEDSAEAQAYQEVGPRLIVAMPKLTFEQEISQVLAHNLSLSEQEAVEAEYSRLQELEVCRCVLYTGEMCDATWDYANELHSARIGVNGYRPLPKLGCRWPIG